MLQRLIRHHRPEVGTADTDIDDVADALSSMAHPLAAAHAMGERRHLVEHGMNLRHDVLAVDDDGGTFRRTERHVQDRPIFRDVDLLAAEHCVDFAAQPRLFGELDEQSERLVIDQIF